MQHVYHMHLLKGTCGRSNGSAESLNMQKTSPHYIALGAVQAFQPAHLWFQKEVTPACGSY